MYEIWIEIERYNIWIKYKSSESSTSSTATSSGAIGGDGGNVFDSADFHAETGQSSQGGLGTGSGGLGTSSSSSSELDVQGADLELLASLDDVMGSHHSGIGGRFFSISFDFHTTGDSDQGFAAREIGHVNKGVIEGSQDVGHSEDSFAFLKN